MTFLQRSRGQIAWLILSLLGMAVSVYLTFVHYQGAPLVCSTGGLIDCESVLSSAYSLVPGTAIPITIPGLLWFIVSGGLALLGWQFRPGERRVILAELIWAALGMLSVFYLVYAEIVVLHKICAWCTVIHITILVMLLLAVIQWQGANDDEAELEDEEEEKQSSLPARHG
jgi:uncharacterized membrane protein